MKFKIALYDSFLFPKVFVCEFLHGSYSCPALKVFGEVSETKLLNAMRRKEKVFNQGYKILSEPS